MTPDELYNTTTTLNNNKVIINNLRDNTYLDTGVKEWSWRTFEFDKNDIKEVYFAYEKFGNLPNFAHTFLIFELDGNEDIALSIEAIVPSNKISLFKGLAKTYKLKYIWSTENDAVTRRTEWKGNTVEKYKLNLSDQQKDTLLNQMIGQTNTINKTLKYYNTLNCNCTTEIVDNLNQFIKKPITGYHRSVPGGIVKVMRNRGLID